MLVLGEYYNKYFYGILLSWKDKNNFWQLTFNGLSGNINHIDQAEQAIKPLHEAGIKCRLQYGNDNGFNRLGICGYHIVFETIEDEEMAISKFDKTFDEVNEAVDIQYAKIVKLCKEEEEIRKGIING